MRKKHSSSEIIEIPHTADEAIEVIGRSLDELFVNAATGMLSIMQINSQKVNTGCQKLSLTEKDLESLLVAFLSEILYIVEQMIYPSNIKVNISDLRIDFTFHSFPIISFGKYIKAVTYNQLHIKHLDNQFQTRLVFDI